MRSGDQEIGCGSGVCAARILGSGGKSDWLAEAHWPCLAGSSTGLHSSLTFEDLGLEGETGYEPKSEIEILKLGNGRGGTQEFPHEESF
jgi:hypothetical protein